MGGRVGIHPSILTYAKN